jgi:hypothetical protein
LEDIETSVHNLSLILDEMLADKNKNMTDLVEKRKTIKETIEQARTRINPSFNAFYHFIMIDFDF